MEDHVRFVRRDSTNVSLDLQVAGNVHKIQLIRLLSLRMAFVFVQTEIGDQMEQMHAVDVHWDITHPQMYALNVQLELMVL